MSWEFVYPGAGQAALANLQDGTQRPATPYARMTVRRQTGEQSVRLVVTATAGPLPQNTQSNPYAQSVARQTQQMAECIGILSRSEAIREVFPAIKQESVLSLGI